MSLLFLLVLTLSYPAASYSSSSDCDLDSDCPDLNTCKDSKCVHKSLNPPAPEEIIGTIVIIILGALSNAGGLGGGTFMVPLLILIFLFQTHEAIPLSQVFVFGGSLLACVLRFKQKHPSRDRPVIMYELNMVMMSPLLVGTTVGVLLNQMFPDWLIQSILSCVLGYCGITIGLK